MNFVDMSASSALPVTIEMLFWPPYGLTIPFSIRSTSATGNCLQPFTPRFLSMSRSMNWFPYFTMALITIWAVTCRFSLFTNRSSRIDFILSDLEDTFTTIPLLEPDVSTDSSEMISSAAPISGYESIRSASRYISFRLLSPANALIERFWFALTHLFCKYLFCCSSSIFD